MLYLALAFPRLALDALGELADGAEPFALVEQAGSRRIVVAANRAARALGVRAGMVAQAAQALCGGLALAPRNAAQQQAALLRLANWALGYSSQVAVHGTSMLLLEIGASQRLFGGLEALLERIAADLAAQRVHARRGIANTAPAARLFARSGLAQPMRTSTERDRAIAGLPLAAAELPAETLEALAGIGVRRFDALLRLPRAELARRFGQSVPRMLDAMHGRLAEPLEPYQPPQRFRAALELPFRVERAESLLFAARRLLVDAMHWLVARQHAAQRLRLALRHEDAPPTTREIGFSTPTVEADALLAVVRAEIERLALPEAVVALEIAISESAPISGRPRDLFARAGEAPEDLGRLVDRLRSRLGPEAVYRIALLPGHRPERAQCRRPAVAEAPVNPRSWNVRREARIASSRAPLPPRPLFLLSEPQPLAAFPEIDFARDRLEGPERIESGWWDEADAARDYYRLETAQGTRYWIYRDRRAAPGTWFVHGVFA